MLSKIFFLLFPLLSTHINGFLFEEHIKKYEDAYLTAMELIKKYGYEGENRTTTTSDGYILSVYRILPNGKLCNEMDRNKPPVLLIHGIEGSSGNFVALGPTRGLAFRLSDQCFDVWLINHRGSQYSQKHVKLARKSPEFWDFSFHELGIYDNPTVMKLVLNETGAEKLLCICHSQGCTSLFVTASLLSEFTQEKVLAILAMSPVSFIGHAKSELAQYSATALEKHPDLEKTMGLGEFPPNLSSLKKLLPKICSDEFRFTQEYICENILWAVVGKDPAQFNATLYPLYIKHFFEGASTKQFYHFGQLVISKQFRQYDYGMTDNMKNYNNTIPPDYPLKKANVPTALWRGDNDILNSIEDFELLVNQLPNVIGKYRVPWNDWNHLDFLTAIDVETLLYNDLYRILSQF